MATISLCMIVKNEERVLKRCLDSIHDLVDEIIIVDTGSTDSTKEIAAKYTDKLYDFQWINDFSAARNFSFSKCSMDYIYVADADEYLDEENRFQFKVLKDNLFPEIEIVQMMYKTISNDTVLNIFKEYRPKLFKRMREFVWINPIHETVRIDPLVFDSDIVVTHEPESNHAKRDFSIFELELEKNGRLSDDLTKMYALELYKNGTKEDFEKALSYFPVITDFDEIRNYDGELVFTTRDYYRIFISLKWLRLSNNENFLTYANSANEILKYSCAEIFYELGEYYIECGDYENASKMFKNATNAESVLDVHVSGDFALKKLIICCQKVLNKYESHKAEYGSDSEMEGIIESYKALLEKYKIELLNWEMPVEELK